MSNSIEWTRIIPEFINIGFAAGFFLLFCLRMRTLSRFSQSQRFSYINPWNRRGFVYVYILVNLFQLGYVLFRVISQSQSSRQSTVQQIAFAIGITVNSFVLVLEIFVMRAELKKQKPYTPVHRLYWLYLPIITTVRLVMQILSYIDNQVSQDERDVLVELVVTSILFVDAVGLCVYSLFCKRQEIEEFENYALFQFDNLEETLQSQHTLFKLGSMERSKEEFQKLTINVALIDAQRLQLKIYYRKEPISNIIITIYQLQRFYQTTSIFELHTKLDFQNQLPNVKTVKNYFDQLLVNWKNYEPFVLDFFKIEGEHREQLMREIKSLRKEVGEEDQDAADPNCIFFNVNIWKIVRVRDHWEFFMNVWTQGGEIRTQVNKRYNQFEEMDRRLREIEVRTLNSAIKLKTPELPDKYYFRMDEEAMDDRMFKLEQYSRRLLNDRVFVVKYDEARSIVFKFFALEEIANKMVERPFPLTNGLSSSKGTISMRMSEKAEPSLVYNFLIKQYSKVLYEISKRYSEVAQFNKQFRRWSYNNQIDTRQIVMPPKMITLNQRQKQQRHYELNAFLNGVLGLPHISELYEFRVLLQRPQRSTRVLTISRENSRVQDAVMGDSQGINSQTMSVLIDKLGEDSSKFVM